MPLARSFAQAFASARSGKNANIFHLVLAGNQVDSEGALFVGRLLAMSTVIRTLDLSNNCIGARGRCVCL